MRRFAYLLLALWMALAITACSGGGGGSIEVGDDTYVPDFKAGSLSFTDVWVEDNMLPGYPVDLWFDIEAEEPKYNVYVKIDLVELEGNASDLEIDPLNYTPDFELTGFVIDSSVVDPFDEQNPQPIVLQKGQKVHVEKTFTMPEGIPTGTYAVVFTINQEDYFPEDDNLQGEVLGEEDENFVVAGSTIVGEVDKPNLRILSTKLENSSFEFEGLELKGPEPDPAYFSKDSVLNLSLEVESMAQDTVEPVDIYFDLAVGEVAYPLWFEVEEADGAAAMTDVWTYAYPENEDECRDLPIEDGARNLEQESPPEGVEVPDEVEEPQTEKRCASLYRQSQVGRTYKLHLGSDAAEALQNYTEETTFDLIITMDSAQEEFENNKEDNVKTLPVIYMPPEPTSSMQALAFNPAAVTWETILSKRSNGGFGNNWFGASYTSAPELKWRKNSQGNPVAAYNKIDFTTSGKLFGGTSEILKGWHKTDMNLENIRGSYFDYGAEVAGMRVWGSRTYMDPGGTMQLWPMTLWSSVDVEGNERYAMSKDFFDKSYWYFPYGIPVNVTANATGEVGLRGRAYIGDFNTFGLEGGPYLNATGTLEGSVSIAVARAGVGGEVTLIDVSQTARATLQLQPDMALAVAKFETPLEVSSLSGELYLFGDRRKWRRWKFYWKRAKLTLLDWDGWTKDFHYYNPIVKSFSTRKFDAEYYKTTSLDKAGDSPYATVKEAAIDHSWYRTGPSQLGGQRTNFSVRWTGDYLFNEGTYTFAALTDDGFRLWVDDKLVLDKWKGQAATQYEVEVSMTEGEHPIKVEYYQGGGGAVAKLLWYKSE